MKVCTECGKESEDNAVECLECGGTAFKEGVEARYELEFEEIPADEADKKWVTLVRARNLSEADTIASRLRAAQIAAFIPDEFSMQTLPVNVNACGFVRVQVHPSRHQEARELLEG